MAFMAIALLTTGCDNAEYDVINNAFYLEEASTAVANKVAIDPINVTTTTITPRLAEAINEDVIAELVIDTAYLREYNQANMTDYEVLPAASYSFEKKIVIKAGKVSAEPILFTITPYSDANGELYAIPVRMKVTQGAISSIGASDKFIFLLNKSLVQSVPVMAATNFAATEADSWSENVNEWTIETWVQMDGFQLNNQAIINSGGNGTEVYIRFGDTSIPFNSLQIKTQGVQVNTVTLFEKNKWYHIAIVYDASGMVTIYVNGTKDVAIQTKGGPATFTQMGVVTSGVEWFRDKCKMAQLRLWRIALGQTRIQSNMHFSLKANDPNMMGYWRMDEGSGNTFKDSTPNAHHMTALGTLEWEPDVQFGK